MKSLKALEKEVSKNVDFVESKLSGLMKKHKNQYAVCHNKQIEFADDFGAGVELGKKQFGEDAGFCVHKVTKEPMIFSALVVL